MPVPETLLSMKKMRRRKKKTRKTEMLIVIRQKIFVKILRLYENVMQGKGIANSLRILRINPNPRGMLTSYAIIAKFIYTSQLNFTVMYLEILRVKDKIPILSKVVIKRTFINQPEQIIIEDRVLPSNVTVV